MQDSALPDLHAAGHLAFQAPPAAGGTGWLGRFRVALVIVGGVGVNTITYDDGMVGRRLEKGQEVSTFRAGGSAFALFSTRPLELVEPLKERAADHGVHLEVLVGETLAN